MKWHRRFSHNFTRSNVKLLHFFFGMDYTLTQHTESKCRCRDAVLHEEERSFDRISQTLFQYYQLSTIYRKYLWPHGSLINGRKWCLNLRQPLYKYSLCAPARPFAVVSGSIAQVCTHWSGISFSSSFKWGSSTSEGVYGDFRDRVGIHTSSSTVIQQNGLQLCCREAFYLLKSNTVVITRRSLTARVLRRWNYVIIGIDLSENLVTIFLNLNLE